MNNEIIYRIKVIEQNNGQLWYVPQVTVKQSKLLKWFTGEKWINIVCYSLTTGTIEESDTTSISFRSEEDAIKVIELHKKELENKWENKEKFVHYKQI